MQTQISLSSKVTADAPSLLTPHDERVIPSFVLTSLHMSSRVLALVVMACGALLLVAACGSEPTADEPSRNAGNLGTRVCLVNNDTGQRTSEDIGDSVTLTATVAFTRKDTAEEGAFPPGKQLCAEGTFGTGSDVIADLTWTAVFEEGSEGSGSYQWKSGFSATNPWMGKPKAELKSPLSSDDPGTFSCLSKGLQVGESMTGDDGIFQMTVTRLADDQWKEFEVVFTPSADPDPFLFPRGITGGGSC